MGCSGSKEEKTRPKSPTVNPLQLKKKRVLRREVEEEEEEVEEEEERFDGRRQRNSTSHRKVAETRRSSSSRSSSKRSVAEDEEVKASKAAVVRKQKSAVKSATHPPLAVTAPLEGKATAPPPAPSTLPQAAKPIEPPQSIIAGPATPPPSPPPPPPPPPPPQPLPVAATAPVATLAIPSKSAAPAPSQQTSSAKAVAPPPASSQLPPLPPGWVEKTSQSTGKTYFFHAAENRTVWERPAAPAAQAAAVLQPRPAAKLLPRPAAALARGGSSSSSSSGGSGGLTVAQGQRMSAEAAKLEHAWVGVGQRAGMQVWRIEKMKPVAWPKERYGEFYSGDAYICLSTRQRAGGGALSWDIHFWLGASCSQDEKGVAAYKTVELDDFLGGAPVQHREVEGHESEAFLALFDNMQVMQGGIESGFNKMRPAEFRPRLLHLRGSKGGKVRQVEVPLNRASLNSDDVFVLDAGMQLFQWNGSNANMFEKRKGSEVTKRIDDSRKGVPVVFVLEEGDSDARFWGLIEGGFGPVAAAPPPEFDAVKDVLPKLFSLSDASGAIAFTLVGEAATFPRDSLQSQDVYILDAVTKVFAWVGGGASKEEQHQALLQAAQYLVDYDRPSHLPIGKVKEGAEGAEFLAYFTQ